MSNELIHESSPYLLQHAHNPVNWLPWNLEVLEKAKQAGKPIIVSIGYSSCHWCHVMEKESFEDVEVASWMNTHFTCVKVDREERPDVDHYYMNAVQHMTGRGGWPLNCFALPDGRVFHGGTYYRRSDWVTLLKRVLKEFTENRDKLESFASQLEEGMQASQRLESLESSTELAEELVGKAIEKWKGRFDLQWGGFDGAPKFPMPNNLDLLLLFAHHSQDEALSEFVELTLDRMSEGGIYDQLGGGFARYSVDPYWKAPHFEKMLYDNAQMLALYARAYAWSGKARYREVLQQTVEWLDREMRDESGLYYSALDADSEGEEGLYYTWTEAELTELFGPDYPLVSDLFLLENRGKWEGGRFILHHNGQHGELASEYSLSPEQLQWKTDYIRRKLMAVRNKRVRPGLDNKCLCSWNALLSLGLMEMYKALGDTTYLDKALNILQVLQSYLDGKQVGDGLMRSYTRGVWSIPAFLDDYAHLIESLRRAYEITMDLDYANRAAEWTDYVIDAFYDTDAGLFRYTAKGNNELSVETFEYFDQVIPASNSVMFRNLVWLDRFFGTPAYNTLAERMRSLVSPRIHAYPGGYSNWMLGILEQDLGSEIVAVGPDAKEAIQSLSQQFLPFALCCGSTVASDLPLFGDRFIPALTQLYLCRKGTCQLPVPSVEKVLELYHNTR